MSQLRQPRRRCSGLGSRRQRGATLIFTAFFLVVLVATIGLAIEVGRLYAAQTQLQKLASLAAIESAWAIGACAQSEPMVPYDAARLAVVDTLDSHFDAGNSLVEINHLELGQRQSENSLFYFQDTGDVAANASLVTLSRPPPATLVSLFSAEDAQMTATAAAFSSPVAGISIGSTLADLGGTSGMNGLLGALLGGQVSLDLASYQGLADADVTIAQLIDVVADVSSVQELLQTDLGLPVALDLLATAVDGVVGTVDDVAADALTLLADVADPNKRVSFGDVLNIEPGLEGVVGALPINVAGLLSGLAQAANTGGPIHLPLGIDLGGLAQVTATINIIQPRQVAFGRAGTKANGEYRTVATTAQANIQLDIKVLHTNGTLPNGYSGALLHLPIFVKASSAEARLEDIICASPSKQIGPRFEHTVRVGYDTALATIGVGKFEDISVLDPEPTETVTLINVLELVKVTTDGIVVNLTSKGCATADTDAIPFHGPFPPQPGAEIQTERADVPLSEIISCGLDNIAAELLDEESLNIVLFGLGSNDCNIPVLCEIINGVVDYVVAPLLAGILQLLRPIINGLGQALLIPLFKVLGLSVGPADISVLSVNAGRPMLFCTGDACSAPVAE